MQIDDDTWTPLHGAACFGEVAVTRYLVIHGANLNATNENGDTPLAVAVEETTKRYLQGQPPFFFLLFSMIDDSFVETAFLFCEKELILFFFLCVCVFDLQTA